MRRAGRILFIVGFVVALLLAAGQVWSDQGVEPVPGAVVSSGEGHGAHGVDWIHGLIYPLINLFLLGGGLFLLLRKPFMEFFRDRSLHTRTELDAAKALYDTSFRQYEEIDTRLKHVQGQGLRLIDEIRAEANEEKTRIVREAGVLAEKIKTDTKRIAEQEVKRALESLKAEAVRLALGLAGKQVKERLKSEDQERLASEFVLELKKGGVA